MIITVKLFNNETNLSNGLAIQNAECKKMLQLSQCNNSNIASHILPSATCWLQVNNASCQKLRCKQDQPKKVKCPDVKNTLDRMIIVDKLFSKLANFSNGHKECRMQHKFHWSFVKQFDYNYHPISNVFFTTVHFTCFALSCLQQCFR